jgi:hypothetical protein
VSYHCIDCYPKTKQITRIPLVSPHSGNGQLQGGNAICFREWLTGPPLVLLPRQEVTELLNAQAALLAKRSHGRRHIGVWLDGPRT